MTNLPRHSNGHPLTGSDHRADLRLLVETASDGTTTGALTDWTDFDDIVKAVEETYDALRTDD